MGSRDRGSFSTLAGEIIGRLHDVDCRLNLGTSSLAHPKFLRSPIQKDESNEEYFLGNLSFNFSEQDISALFEAYGTVDHVNIVSDCDTDNAEALDLWSDCFIGFKADAQAYLSRFS